MASWPWQGWTNARPPKTSDLADANSTGETESRGLSAPLIRVRRIGQVLLGLQWISLMAWTTLLYHRFVLSIDYAFFSQTTYLITHGDLNPYDTIFQFQAWRNHSDMAMWPLALSDLVWPHGLWLNWIQASCVAAAELIAFHWLCEVAHERLPGRSRDAAWLAGVGLVLLVANPWIWEGVSFDFHEETLAAPFAVLMAYDMAKDRRRAWVWTVPLLLIGDVSITYVVGIGLGAALVSRKWRIHGGAMACLGICAVLLITLVHGNVGIGAGLSMYDYLAVSGPISKPLGPIALIIGTVCHPLRLLGVFWAKRSLLWSNLAPSGLLGLAFPPLLPLFTVVLAANTLAIGYFDTPSFQSIVFYLLVPVGTVAVLGSVWRRHALVAWLLASLVVMQAVGWAVVWGPQLRGQWLRVSASTAGTLASVAAQIPASAEVVASSGVVGGFATHANVLPLEGPGEIPVTGQTWFIIVPEAGIEQLTTDSAMALVGELAGPLHAHLVTRANGVWAFRLQPSAGMHFVTVPGGYGNFAPQPAWAATAPAGRSIITGSPNEWRMSATGGKGYVSAGLAWQEPLGRYQAEVKLSASGPISVEVWNDTDYRHDVLLARRQIPATRGPEMVSLLVNVSTANPHPTFTSWGPFIATFWQLPAGQRLELRVWSPGDESVNVYDAQLFAVPSVPGRAPHTPGKSG